MEPAPNMEVSFGNPSDNADGGTSESLLNSMSVNKQLVQLDSHVSP